MNKFNATTINSSIHGKFDSNKEYKYYLSLLPQKNAIDKEFKVISINRQVRYDIALNGLKIGFYKLDFEITYANGRKRYIDIKGCKTGCAYQLFRLKKKLVEAIYSIKIEEL